MFSWAKFRNAVANLTSLRMSSWGYIDGEKDQMQNVSKMCVGGNVLHNSQSDDSIWLESATCGNSVEFL